MNKFIWLFYFLIILPLAFLLGQKIAKADDCNDKQIEKTYQEIRTIWLHPDSNYLILQDKDKELIKKKLPQQPELKVYLH